MKQTLIITLFLHMLLPLFMYGNNKEKKNMHVKKVPVIISNTTSEALPNKYQKLIKDFIQNAKEEDSDVVLEIDGFMVDETKTRNGKEFYDLFYKSWIPPKGASDFSITIKETPFRLTTTLITVTINENEVFKATLRPTSEYTSQIVNQAIYKSRNFLTNYKEIMQQMNGDDLIGNGIY